MLTDWLECVGNGLRRFVNGDFGLTIGGFVVIFLVGLAFIVTVAAVSAQWELVGIYVGGMLIVALLFFGIWFLLALLRLLIECGIGVIARAFDAGAPGAPTAVGVAIASGGVTTCEAARALLAQAQAALAAAEAARNAQAERVAQATQRVRNATSMLVAAIASAVAAIFQPWAIVGALAAVAAAIALVAHRARQLAQELGALALREAELLRALADVAAAEALVAVLCATSPTGSSNEPPGLLGGGRVPVLTSTP